jgi:RNA polymerase sigma factor (sigma-70 family)
MTYNMNLWYDFTRRACRGDGVAHDSLFCDLNAYLASRRRLFGLPEPVFDDCKQSVICDFHENITDIKFLNDLYVSGRIVTFVEEIIKKEGRVGIDLIDSECFGKWLHNSLVSYPNLVLSRKIALHWRDSSRRRDVFALYAEEVRSHGRSVESPEEVAARNDLRKRVSECLDKLPAELKEAIVNKECERLTQNEVAKKIAKPLGTAKDILRKARARLRECLGNGE